MEDMQKTKLKHISIEVPISAKQMRSLDPHEPTDELSVSSQRIFDLQRARALSSWQSIRSISIRSMTTKAAIRQLLSVSGLEELNISSLHEHSSIKGMPKPTSLRTFRCGWLRRDDLLNIAELPSLTTLSAQNSMLSNDVLKKLISMEDLTNLDLEASNLDDEMAAMLATSKKISQLDIGASRVGRRGLQSICNMAQLRELDIWALDIQENDLDMLGALSNLEYLSVGGYDEQTVLTAKGVLPRIAQLPPLKSLWLDGIVLTKDEVVKLEKRHGRVQVTFVE